MNYIQVVHDRFYQVSSKVHLGACTKLSVTSAPCSVVLALEHCAIVTFELPEFIFPRFRQVPIYQQARMNRGNS